MRPLWSRWLKSLCVSRSGNPRSQHVPLGVEPLEDRSVPATLISPTTLTYQDFDGDDVTLKFTKSILNAGNVNTIFQFSSGAGAVNGSNATKEALQSINLTGVAGAAGTNVSLTATRHKTHGGDGFATLGELFAPNLDLGAVTIDGDLGRVIAGNAITTTPGMASLTVQSLGRFGIGTGAADLHTVITGKLGSLTVKGDVVDAFLDILGGANGDLGTVTINGSLLGFGGDNAGLIHADGDMGQVTILGDMTGGSGARSARIDVDGNLAGLNLGGSLRGGTGQLSGRVEADGNIGFVKIGGDVVGPGFSSGFIAAAGNVSLLTIGGSLIGIGDRGGHVDVGGTITILTINGDLVGGSADGDTFLTESGFIGAKRIGTLTIGRSVIAGVDNTTNTFLNNGAIRVQDDLVTATIKGSLVGNTTNPVIISARGQATPSALADVAIGTLTVKGRVDHALILGGVDRAGNTTNADAQIRTVTVGGDWIASSLAAGAVPGGNNNFGDGDDVKAAGLGVKDAGSLVSRIKSLTIAGQMLGTVPGGDQFGIVAENIGAVKIGGTVIDLVAGSGNDDVAVGITGDVRINEI